MSTDPAETIALFRYHVVADATNSRLTPAERGALIRQLARQPHQQPDGSTRVYSRATLDRWVRAYREQGLDGLRPQPRADLGVVRRHPELLEEAARLRLEIPPRSGAQISAILQARHRVRVAERTIRQYLQRRELLHRRGAKVVHHEIEAGLEDVGGDRLSHVPEADVSGPGYLIVAQAPLPLAAGGHSLLASRRLNSSSGR